MSNQTVPTITKIDVLEKANAIVLEKGQSIGEVVVGKVGDVVLAIDVAKGEFEAQPSGEFEYQYCVRGTVQVRLAYGDQELPPFEFKAGEFLTIPPGFTTTRGTASGDAVVLVIENRGRHSGTGDA